MTIEWWWNFYTTVSWCFLKLYSSLSLFYKVEKWWCFRKMFNNLQFSQRKTFHIFSTMTGWSSLSKCCQSKCMRKKVPKDAECFSNGLPISDDIILIGMNWIPFKWSNFRLGTFSGAPWSIKRFVWNGIKFVFTIIRRIFHASWIVDRISLSQIQESCLHRLMKTPESS